MHEQETGSLSCTELMQGTLPLLVVSCWKGACMTSSLVSSSFLTSAGGAFYAYLSRLLN